MSNYILTFAFAFILHLFLVDFLSIHGVRPDFFLIFVLYIGIREGHLWGVITGFTIGLLSDLLGVSSHFGLSSLTYVIVGYGGGFLHKQHLRLEPLIFHISWVLIVLIAFFVYVFFSDLVVGFGDYGLVWSKWIYTSIYTLGFLLILQPVVPLRKKQ
ncbi:MAG: rod shape-determining protein MreD [Candidatus Neomarinimicrobiota bacterium]